MAILRRSILLPVWICLLFGLAVAHAAVMANGPAEHEVKAAFILNFTKFVNWPSAAFQSANSPILISIQGDSRVAEALHRMASQKIINGRRVEITTSHETAAHVVFIGAAGSFQPGKSITPWTLTVADHSTTGSRAVIRLFVENERVGFAISRSAATQANLQISSKLMSLSRLEN